MSVKLHLLRARCSHLPFSQHEEVQLMYAGYSCYAYVEW